VLPLARMVAVLLGMLVRILLFSFFCQVLEKACSLLTCTYNYISACRIANAILTLLMLRTGNVTREESKTQDKGCFLLPCFFLHVSSFLIVQLDL